MADAGEVLPRHKRFVYFPRNMSTSPDKKPRHESLADSLSSGITQVDLDQRIIWANKPFRRRFAIDDPVGKGFYDIFVDPALAGPDYCPLETVRSTGRGTTSKIWVGPADKRSCFEFDVTPDFDENGQIEGCFIEMRDVTELMLVDETLRKLQNVGRLLVDLSSEELALMSAEGRKTLLAEKIKENMREILAYDAIEFRLYDEENKTLVPFINFGIDEEASQCPLAVSTDGGGISGYVASTKHSYLCEDTVNEPGYIPGLKDARCSITVPILWYDLLIGTCNVESKIPGAFSDRDTYFLKIFAHDVAAALHTLELLSHENEFGARQSVDRIFRSVTIPIDRIIEDASLLLDRHKNDSGDDQILKQILLRSRTIHDQITAVLQTHSSDHPLLANRRVLILDKDDSNVQTAHHIFEPYGCSVESSSNANTALSMIRLSHYDVIISELYPEGMNGFQLLIRLHDMFPDLPAIPLVLAADIGVHDKGHIVAMANGRGLLGTVARPLQPNNHFFRIIELVITTCGQRDAEGNLLGANKAPSVLNSPRPTVEVVTKGRSDGFYHRQGADRFRAWLDLIPDRDRDDNNLSDDTDSSGLDAT